MKHLVLMRGIPGSGKTTLARLFFKDDDDEVVFTIAADDYFDRYHGGRFVPSEIKEAHAYCQRVTESLMNDGETVIVHNTFTRESEMEPYFKLAKKYGYKIHTVIVENRHGNESVHDVPDDTIKKMRNRFEVSL